MSFEKHLNSVSRAASHRLGILRNSWRVFHDRSLPGRCFRGFVFPVFEIYFAVWCSAADTHLKLLDRVAIGARFLTGGVFECDIAHRRSVAVLCMLYKIRCNPVHPFNGALPGPYVLWSHIGSLMRCLAAEPRCRASQYRLTFIPSQWPSGTIFLTPCSTVSDRRVSRAGQMLSHWPKLLYPYYSLLLFSVLTSFCLKVGIVGAGVFGLIWCISLSQPCTAYFF